jgi:hypothetical protein
VTIDLDSFEFLNPEDASVGIHGSGLAVRAAWDGQSLAHWKPATSVEVELPPAEISDVGVVGRLLPVNGPDVTSGTGTLSAQLAVDADRQASGQLDLTTAAAPVGSARRPDAGGPRGPHHPDAR